MKAILKGMLTGGALVILAATSAMTADINIGMNKAGTITLNGQEASESTLKTLFPGKDGKELDQFITDYQTGCKVYRGDVMSLYTKPDPKKPALQLYSYCKEIDAFAIENNMIETSSLNGYGVKTSAGFGAACVTLTNWAKKATPRQIEQLWALMTYSNFLALDSQNLMSGNMVRGAAALFDVMGEDKISYSDPVFLVAKLGRAGLRQSPLHAFVAAAAAGNEKKMTSELNKMNEIVNGAQDICGGALPPLPATKNAYKLP